MPENVSRIIGTLTEHGYEAYAVGGCVRDSIIHNTPNDWDITTSALPAQVKALFRRTIDTGIKHGTVTIMIGNEGYEVTTYRIDGEYEDGRHPKQVEFTSSLEEDLRRRDFTINAMACNDEGIVDLFGGREDIDNRIIRCVGEAVERFSEDALRMLRAVRFSAQLGYTIEEGTAAAITALAPTISKVSKERIHMELGKLLLSDNPDYISKIHTLGLGQYIFPVYEALKDKDLAGRLLKALPKDIAFRYAGAMYDAGDGAVRKMLKELKLDNLTIKRSADIIKLHDLGVCILKIPTSDAYERMVRAIASQHGVDEFKDALAFDKVFYTVCGDNERCELVKHELEILDIILKRGDALKIGDLAISGDRLIEMGMESGKQIGDVLKMLLDDVIANPEHNNAQYLEMKAREAAAKV